MNTTMNTHSGNACPCHVDTIVQVDLGDGQLHVGPAGSWAWGPGLGDDGEGRIHSWVPLVPAVGHAVTSTERGQST